MKLLVLSVVAAVTACDASSTAPSQDAGGARSPRFEPGAPTIDPFDADAAVGSRVDALFGASCTGGPETFCHGSGAGRLHLRLGPGPGGDLVDVPSSERPDLTRVRLFDPEASYLYLKVRGDGGIEGGRMPLGADGDPRIPSLVQSWIEAGAPAP